MGNALGLIETVGLGAAIVAADAAHKTANITDISLENTKGAGMVVVKFQGDVSSVRAALEAGTSVAQKISSKVIGHLIPQPAIPVTCMSNKK